MSDYQSYTFLAIDRPLSPTEHRTLRGISTRAEITPHRFSNVYRWGDLKADADDLVDRYFDACLHVTNRGTVTLQLRVPRSALPPEVVVPYVTVRSLTVRETSRHTIVRFERRENEPFGAWGDLEARLVAALPVLRWELACGDLRALYLGWLLGVRQGDVTSDGVEPPVPIGMQVLPESLEALVLGLGLDPDLLAEAALASPTMGTALDARLLVWLSQVSAGQKDAWLAQVMQGEGSDVASALWSGFRAVQPSLNAFMAGCRTAGDLLAAAKVGNS
jgi:hypothetical protein